MQAQKLLINHFRARSALFSATALSIGLLLYGCGENKISQCNKVVTVANKTKALTVPKDITGFVQLSENIDQIRIEVQEIAVQDPKLKELQTQLSGMYGDISTALKAQAKASEAKDSNALTKAKQELDTAAGKEGELVDRINALCAK